MISEPREPGEQQRLWPEPDKMLDSDAARRVRVGEFFEAAAARLLGASRMRTCSTRYCPDLMRGPRDWFEVKAVGASGTLVVLLDRLLRDVQETAEHDASLTYIVFQHDAPVAAASSLSTLRRMLAEHTRSVIAVPLAALLLKCREKQPVSLTLRSAPASNKPIETRLGYRVAMSRLQRVVDGQEQMIFDLPVLGERIVNFSAGGLTPYPLPYGAVTERVHCAG